jgi:predicted nucleic acid-binding protein
MNALLDTNIILDAITGRKGADTTAQQILEKVGEAKFEGYLTANSISDIYYILQRHQSRAQAHRSLSDLFELFSIIGICQADCYDAHESEIADFEDALLVVCAQTEGVDVIVTSDVELLSYETHPPLITPQRFLQLLAAARN